MKTVLASIRIFLALTLLTGVVYPLVVIAVAQAFFSRQANGSLLVRDGKPVGSELIGQNFTREVYFQSRPSATAYNPLPSGGSNLSPASNALLSFVRANEAAFLAANPSAKGRPVPADMLLASCSGLDPHISVESALLQADRVARARGLDSARKNEIISLIGRLAEGRDLGFLGEPRINVLKLNLALDEMK